MPTVASAAVAEYRPLCTLIAERWANMAESAERRGSKVAAEFDDLEQEGMIACWQSLARGIRPTEEIIEERVRGWFNWQRRQKDIDYQTAMPLDDYSQV